MPLRSRLALERMQFRKPDWSHSKQLFNWKDFPFSTQHDSSYLFFLFFHCDSFSGIHTHTTAHITSQRDIWRATTLQPRRMTNGLKPMATTLMVRATNDKWRMTNGLNGNHIDDRSNKWQMSDDMTNDKWPQTNGNHVDGKSTKWEMTNDEWPQTNDNHGNGKKPTNALRLATPPFIDFFLSASAFYMFLNQNPIFSHVLVRLYTRDYRTLFRSVGLWIIRSFSPSISHTSVGYQPVPTRWSFHEKRKKTQKA